MTRWIAETERAETGETWIAEEASTLREVFWLVSTLHMDEDGRPQRSGRPGLYYYTSPRGKQYTIRRVEA